MTLPDLEHQFVTTNGVKLHVVTSGPKEGPLVVLLHGFPEYWKGWKSQIPALVKAGYRVIIPDQRGYNTSEKPPKISDYDIDLLAQDILGLIDHEGREKAHIIGHDWGAVVAWWMGIHHSERINKLAILNVPHPLVMRRHLLTNPTQLKKSWYILFFQIPKVPERLFARNGGKKMLDALKATSNPGSFTDEDLAGYAESWANKGCPTAMVNWYRAMMRRVAQSQESQRVSVPTQMIWGKQDVALGSEMAAPSIAYCDQGQLEIIEEATHWVQHDAPQRVNKILLGFLKD
jgi:pimeloyl-ACP methyl ester carboxylesterase